MGRIKFKSFSSGSCGNCYYLGIFREDGSCKASILIDAGVSPRRLRKEFASDGLSLDGIDAILVTHDHLDHIRSLGSFCKHLGKPVWATGKLLGALSRHFMTGEHLGPLKKELSEGWNDIVPGSISARWFEVPHDATQTVGFAIRLEEHLYVHVTDCGKITEEAAGWCGKADTLILESNYDSDMLYNGSYPEELQERISGGNGHLSNKECAEVLKNCRQSNLKNVFLCHLSEHNNTPRLALESAREAMPDFPRIIPLPRQTPSPLFNLEKIL